MRRIGPSAGVSLDDRLDAFRATPRAERAAPLALDLLEAGRAQDALEVLRSVSRDGAPALLLLEGRALLAVGEPVPAQAAFVKAAKAMPRDARPYIGLGEVLLARGDPMRAIKALRKARTLDPSNREIVALLERARAAAGVPSSVPPPSKHSPRPAASEPKSHRGAPPSAGTTVRASIHEAATVVSDMSRIDAAFEDETTTRSEAPSFPHEAHGRSDLPPATEDEEPTNQWNAGSVPPEGVFSTRREALSASAPRSPANPPPGLFETHIEPPTHASSEPPSAPRPTPTPTTNVGPEFGETVSAAPAVPPDDPAALLATLRSRHLLMEAPEHARWASHASPEERTRVGRPLAVAWGIVFLLVAAGAGGWHLWTQHRRAQANALLEKAREAAMRGEHESLVDAERWLRQARRLHPRRAEIPATLLFVMSQRALEEGRFESNLIRPALARARKAGADDRLLHLGETLLLLTEGKRDEADEQWRTASDSPEPHLAYLLGRIGERLGKEGVEDKLRTAAEAAPRFAAPRIALLERAFETGDRERASALADEVLARQPGHMRARLWKARIEADDVPPDRGLATLAAFDEETMKKAAPVDHVLLGLARARLLRRKQDLPGAKAAIEQATEAGISDPRLLAALAEEALASRAMGLAEALASRAMASAPAQDTYRLLLADILLARRAGVKALRVLAPLSNRNAHVLRASAEAALLVGSRDALEAAAKALEEYASAHGSSAEDPTLQALSLRLRARLGDATSLLPEVRALAHRTPGDSNVRKALGDIALRAHQPEQAVESLEKLVQLAPEDAEAWYLLGRARRAAGHIAEAEEALRRAVELAPSYADALVSLGYLLLDRGRYEEAEKLYASLSRRAGPASGASLALLGRVGRAEALIGLGRLEDARVQLQAIKKRDAERPFVRIVRARLALAAHEPSKALTLLRPLAKEESPSARVLVTMARALLAAGEPDAAKNTVERLLARDPSHPDGLAIAAELRLRAGDYEGVLRATETALREMERRARPPALKAKLLLLAARASLEGRPPRPEQAARWLRKAVTLPGAPPAAWFFLGEALASLDAAKARQAYSKYLELAPKGALARRARKALR